jgi:REP element-mobilizing transposase RayT
MPKHPSRKKQLEFNIDGFKKPGVCFGGSLLKGNPKTKRPLDSKSPVHLNLRANQGGMRLPKTFGKVHELIHEAAKKYGVKIFDYANVGNHIHLLIQVTKIKLWSAFIRELTGRIAQVCRELGVAVKGDGFWRTRPFTRIVAGWQKAFRIMKDYIYLNKIEADGYINRKETKTLKDLRALLSG